MRIQLCIGSCHSIKFACSPKTLSCPKNVITSQVSQRSRAQWSRKGSKCDYLHQRFWYREEVNGINIHGWWNESPKFRIAVGDQKTEMKKHYFYRQGGGKDSTEGLCYWLQNDQSTRSPKINPTPWNGKHGVPLLLVKSRCWGRRPSHSGLNIWG